MCGIAGFFEAAEHATPERIGAMTDRLIHRGPNDHGFLLVNTQTNSVATAPGTAGFYDLALGHRRLSILDLSEAGRQPMSSADERYWVVFNGEIYNFKDLRKDLEARGHVFRSASDSE